MAFYYGNRGPQSPRDEPNLPAYSPQRNPNRLSGGMMSTNSARGGLPRRFTTNELPTLPNLSPIGLQRKQAAGDYLVSSNISVPEDNADAVVGTGAKSETEVEGRISMPDTGGMRATERVVSGTASLGGRPSTLLQGSSACKRVNSRWVDIGDEMPCTMRQENLEGHEACLDSGREQGGYMREHRLTRSDQPSGYAKPPPVSLPLRFSCLYGVGDGLFGFLDVVGTRHLCRMPSVGRSWLNQNTCRLLAILLSGCLSEEDTPLQCSTS